MHRLLSSSGTDDAELLLGVNNALEAATINVDPAKAKLQIPLCSLLSYEFLPSLRSKRVQSCTTLLYDDTYSTGELNAGFKL